MTPYSMEYTYFTNKLFVTFGHLELHKYLFLILQKPQPLTASATASAEERQAVTDRNEEIDDHAVLPYVVLHAAQMHPIDLRREVSAIGLPTILSPCRLQVRSLPTPAELLLGCHRAAARRSKWSGKLDGTGISALAHEPLLTRALGSRTRTFVLMRKGASFTQYLIEG